MTTVPRILVAGIGNIFRGDDAFGSELARRLMARALPDEVRVMDFGIRGLDLTYALLDGYEKVVLLDATPRGGKPGTLYVIEAEPDGQGTDPTAPLAIEPHNLDPAKVLQLARALGACVKRILVVGCEPANCGGEDEMPAGLSRPVQAALDEAIPLVESLIARLLAEADEEIRETGRSLESPSPDQPSVGARRGPG